MAGGPKLPFQRYKAGTKPQALSRLVDLVERDCRYPIDDERVAQFRNQLLTAWAATLSEAAGSAHAVLALHEFRNDQRPDHKAKRNDAELARFADVVLGCELPSPGSPCWCVWVPDVAGSDAALYVAHVVTDLRGASVRPE